MLCLEFGLDLCLDDGHVVYLYRWMLRCRIVTISERLVGTIVGWTAESTFRNTRSSQRWRRVKSEGDAARCGPDIVRRGRYARYHLGPHPSPLHHIAVTRRPRTPLSLAGIVYSITLLLHAGCMWDLPRHATSRRGPSMPHWDPSQGSSG